MSGWKLAKLKTDPGGTGKLSGQLKFVFTFLKDLLDHQQKIHDVIGYFYSSKPKMIVIGFMHFVSLNISCTNLINPNENISCPILV